MTKPTLLILAAGMGSRYGGLKQLDRLGPSGETIMDYSVFDAIRAGFGKIVFVIRDSFKDDFEEAFLSKIRGKIDVEVVFQELDNLPEGFSLPEDRTKPWGTGHAIMMAKDVIKEPFTVINADDFYGKEAFEEMSGFLTSDVSESLYAMCGYKLGNTLSDFGSVARGVCKIDSDSNLSAINERLGIVKDGDAIVYEEDGQKYPLSEDDIVSMNFWGFHQNLFGYLDEKFKLFLKDNINTPKSEFFIPFVIDDLMKEGKVKTRVLKSDAKWFGVTYKEDKPVAIEELRKLVDAGVYPEKLW